MRPVLIVDDDPVQLRQTADLMRNMGYEPVPATSGEGALALMRIRADLMAVVLDLVMPELDGMGVMDSMLRESIALPVILQSVAPDLGAIEAAIRRGALDVLPKPITEDRLAAALGNARRIGGLEALTRGVARPTSSLLPSDMIARCPDMARVTSVILKATRSALPVLVEGEAGTGKHMVARIIHGLGSPATGERPARPFVTLDCSALAPQALEAALFGAGAGPGRAVAAGPGSAFRQAHGGTLYLREIGALSAKQQEKLLGVLTGATGLAHAPWSEEAPKVRLIASNRQRLLDLTIAGAFREDLFYHLNVLPAFLPPLRARTEDVVPLTEAFIARFAAEGGRAVTGASESAFELLRRSRWPGNVRQLELSVFRAVSLAERNILEPGDFPQIAAEVQGRSEALRLVRTAPPPAEASMREGGRGLPDPDRFIDDEGRLRSAAAVERAHIAFAIEQHKGHLSHVARALGIGRSTLYRKLREYGLVPANGNAA